MRQRPARAGRILYVMKYRVLAAFCGALQFATGAAAAAQSPAKDTLRLSIEEAVATGLKVADEVAISFEHSLVKAIRHPTDERRAAGQS